jgi:arylsulfatase A-like enzyme
MTGLYPDQTLIRQNAIRLRERLPDVQSLSQMFRRNGYTATRVGKIYHYNVPRDIGLDGHDDPASWDHKFNPRGRDKTDEANVFSLVPRQYGGTLSWLAADGTDAEQTDGIGATEAIKVLASHAESKKPFFLAVGFYRPHTPFVSPKKYFEMYPPEKMIVPDVPEGYLETLPAEARRSIRRKKDQIDLRKDLAQQAIGAYYASITFVDGQVGRVVDAVERLGLQDDTIILFTSDHGYHMGEHGHWQKTTLFENAARVPLIVSVPGMKTAGAVADSPAEMLDFYPTLAELCDLPAPKNLSGVSLAPVLESPSAAPRTAALTQYASGYSIRTARYRYTEWGPGGRGGAELYDHDSDAAEMVNTASRAESAKIVADLSKLLRKRVTEARKVPGGLKQTKPTKKK